MIQAAGRFNRGNAEHGDAKARKGNSTIGDESQDALGGEANTKRLSDADRIGGEQAEAGRGS